MKHKSQTFSSSLKYTHSHFHLFDYIIAACMVYTTKLQLNTGLMQASKGITKLASTPLPSNRQHNNTSQNYDARAPVCEYCIPNNLIEQQHPPYSCNKNSALESETQNKHIRWLLTLVVWLFWNNWRKHATQTSTRLLKFIVLLFWKNWRKHATQTSIRLLKFIVLLFWKNWRKHATCQLKKLEIKLHVFSITKRERGSNTRSPKFLIPMYLAWFRV